MWGPIFEIGDAAALAGEAPSTPTAACSKGSRRTSPLLLGDSGVDGFPRCTAGTRPARAAQAALAAVRGHFLLGRRGEAVSRASASAHIGPRHSA